ncbi:hypothetical protein [Butyrivibrio fibrisolvens]|uniref:hypothetical protein n=1 Tax=Butyrivibrio fibrisolvens TaxID=831 RepID=UPI000412C2DE|nr:hypothetical protein [Butyrivibrio fibrisolvens]
MKRLYRILLDFNAISLLFVVYLIKKHNPICFWGIDFSYVIYIVGIMLFTFICLVLSRFLPDELISGGIKEVELADSSYLPSFLGYFFVALSVEDGRVLWSVAIIIFIFTYYSQILYFNPLFLIFRYRFYYITMDNGMKLFILSRKTIKSIDGLAFDSLKRINDYTFIDRSRVK